MADDVKDTPLARRLESRRNSGPGLHRMSMPDGGEAWSGPLADRALKAVGARAFTVDKSVILSRAFDVNKDEDKALYGHEKFHQKEGERKAEGADFGASHGGVDLEEKAARAVEAMILHRTKEGEDFGQIMSDVNSGEMGEKAKKDDPQKEMVSAALIGGDKDRDPMDGYKAMLKDGRTHLHIVRELKDYVMAALERINEDHAFRSSEGSFLNGPR